MNDQVQLGKIKIPFTPYDIFGYVIPGTTFFITIFLFETWVRNIIVGPFHSPLYTTFYLTKSIIQTKSWVFSLFYVIAFLLLSYTIGHIIATLSSLFVDRTLVYKGHGYPFEFLLKERNMGSSKPPLSRAYYRGTFFWINLYLLLKYTYHFFYYNYYLLILSKIVIITVAIITIIKITGSTIKASKNSSLYNFFYNNWGICLTNILRHTIKFYAILYDCIASPLSRFINSRKSFDEDFIIRYKKHFISNFNFESEKASTNNYWLPYCYVIDKSPELSAMITNWLHLYSFSRNLSTAFYIAYLYTFFSLWSQTELILNQRDIIMILAPVFLLFLSCLMLIRYYYLYVLYYSKFLFRSFVYLNETAQK